MKILSSYKKFKGKIINIHPSLLPKYKGINTHSRVIKNKENYTDAQYTGKFKLDSGKLYFKKIKIIKNEMLKILPKEYCYKNKYIQKLL